jgi:regulator of sigma E protease
MVRTSRDPPTSSNLAEVEYLAHEGKVRAVAHDSLVLADMLYSLNYTPLGGFVRLAGENNPAVPRSLASKGAGTRFLVLVAGPLMNALLPIALFVILFMVPRDVAVGNVVVEEVAINSPAAVAGVRSGDIILKAGGHTIENPSDLTRAITLNLGSDMEWRIDRAGREEVILLRPRFNPPEGQGPSGVRIGLANARVESRSDPPWVAIPRGFSNTWEVLVLLKQEVSGWIAGGRAPELSGPIGIAQATGEVTAQGGFSGWLVLVILFSINLAILNILPIPMLDGGRLVFVILEWLRRGKRVPPEKEGLVHLIGFVVLIGAILLISVNDINRLLQGRSILGG